MKQIHGNLKIVYNTNQNYVLHSKQCKIILTAEDIDDIYQYKQDVENGPNDE